MYSDYFMRLVVILMATINCIYIVYTFALLWMNRKKDLGIAKFFRRFSILFSLFVFTIYVILAQIARYNQHVVWSFYILLLLLPLLFYTLTHYKQYANETIKEIFKDGLNSPVSPKTDELDRLQQLDKIVNQFKKFQTEDSDDK